MPVSETGIAVCVCTYRRPSIVDTLLSIGRQRVPDNCQVSIIVADNDSVPSARERVTATAARIPFPVTYLHAPEGNISIARNACLAHCEQEWVAFLDDDESAPDNWLCALLAVAARTDAEVILGRVVTTYDEQAPAWMRQGRFHDTCPTWKNGEIQSGYTCNVLMKFADPRVRAVRFDVAHGRSGGEDTVYFKQLHEAGIRIAYAEDAVVTEPVPAERATLRWLLNRHFRQGQTHAILLLANSAGSFGRLQQIVLAAAKVLVCMLGTACSAHDAVRWRKWLLRAAMHGGVVARIAGVAALQQYGHQAKPCSARRL